MYYIIQFYKPTSPDKKLSEQFPNLPAIRRWKTRLKWNGYEVESITKVTKTGASNGA